MVRSVPLPIDPESRFALMRSAAKRAVKRYCKRDGISKKHCRTTLEWLEEFDTADMSGVDWFLVFDALGSECPELHGCDDLQTLYRLAGSVYLIETLTSHRRST